MAFPLPQADIRSSEKLLGFLSKLKSMNHPQKAAPLPETMPDERPHAHRLLAWDTGEQAWRIWSAAMDETAAKPLTEVRLVTYNVWFDTDSGIDIRHDGLRRLVFEAIDADVVCLQEVTSDSYSSLQADERVRREWIVTDFNETLALHPGSWYGTVQLVRRSFLQAHGLALAAFHIELPTRAGRALEYLHFSHTAQPLFRIGTAHLDGSPIIDLNLRIHQIELGSRLLQAGGVPAIFAGDFNLDAISELDSALTTPYEMQDAMRGIDEAPTFNLNYPADMLKTARIDIALLSKQWRVVEGRRLGDRALTLSEDAERPKLIGRDGGVFPSDHLGVYVRAALRSPPV